MKSKSTTWVSLILAMALALGACSGTDNDPDNGGTTDPGTGTSAPMEPTTTTIP